MRALSASAVAVSFSAVFSASSFAFALVSRAVSPRGFIIFLHQGFVIGRIGRLIMDVRPQPVARGVGQVAQLAAEPGRMRLDRLATQPDGSRYRGTRRRQSVAAQFVAASLGGVADRFADRIFSAAED